MTETQICPCGSTESLKSCCLPFIEGKKKPSSAEQLLRSRYTAFTTHNVDYILSTHHSKTRDQINPKEVEDWSRGSEWMGLEIVNQQKGQPADEQGMITFHARYRADGKDHDHWEQSFFEKEGGEWRFLDAQGVKQEPLRRTEPKVGRNDPCSCGSGKKFKKCCGA